MYSFNLENIVPSGDLACLIAKATVDETNKWHRRMTTPVLLVVKESNIRPPPVTTENKANITAGSKEANNSAEAKNGDEKLNGDTGSKINKEPVDHEDQVFLEELERLKRQENEADDVADTLRKTFAKSTKDLLLQAGAARASNTNYVNTTSTIVNTAITPVNTASPSRNVIETKWVYMNKKDERGILVRNKANKARLVAQGHRQEEGIDYDEVFAHVARIEAIRIFLAFASYMGFIVYQMDVKSAFLYGKIDKEVYVSQPLGFIDPKFPKKTASTLIETKKPLVKDAEAVEVDVHLYRSMIGSLMYLTASRPDIMYVVFACFRFRVTPKTSHLHDVKRIFRYLKCQPKLSLWYPRELAFDLESYSDSDYAGADLDRKSTTGGCQFLDKVLISWQCKKQTIVATLTIEAEYVAAASCCGQVLWIQNQILDYGFNFMKTKIYIDNESTICIVKNPMFHSKTQHIEIRYHFIRDAYEKKLIQVLKIHTDDNVVDLLTKAFDVSRCEEDERRYTLTKETLQRMMALRLIVKFESAILPESLTSPKMKETKAYKTYLGFATGATPPKKAQKFKKPASPQLTIVLVSPEEPTKKSKRERRPTKKSSKAPAGGVVIRETPEMPLSKKKEKIAIENSGIVTKTALSAAKIKPSVTNEGIGVKPGVPGVTEEESSKSEAESWGKNEDDTNNEQDSKKEEEDEFVRTLSNDSDDDTNISNKAKGDEDEDIDYTTSQLFDDVDIRLNKPVQVDDETTEVLVISSSHSSDLASKFLNFSVFPHTDAEIVSPVDVYVHHEGPCKKTPTLLTIPISVITESSPIYSIIIPQSIPSFTPPPSQSTPTPPPTTEATNLPSTLLDFALVFQFDNRVTTLEKEVVELKKDDPLKT
nr:putative ribonuclease H-like domain-containing protein [Tanacetum cinerariifolium]